MLGGSFEAVDAGFAEEHGLKVDHGVYVSSVDAEGPLAEAGIQEGDVVLSVNGEEVSSPEDIEDILSGLSAGDTVTFEVDRDGERLTFEVLLDDAVPLGAAGIGLPNSGGGDAAFGSSEEPGNWFLDNLALAIACIVAMAAAVAAAAMWLLRRRAHGVAEDDDDDFWEDDVPQTVPQH